MTDAARLLELVQCLVAAMATARWLRPRVGLRGVVVTVRAGR